MYMPSQKLDIPQNIINSDIKSIKQWLNEVQELISLNDRDMVLYCKNMDSEADVLFLISTDTQILMNVEQSVLEKNCSMTLKQWKECLNSLARKFGENSYLYPSVSSNTYFFLSPMV